MSEETKRPVDINEDADMKIAGLEEAGELPEDPATLTEQLEHQTLNGNLDRAKRLGGLLAGMIAAMETEFNRQALAAFAVETGIGQAIDNEFVARTAHSAFYETLRLAAPELEIRLQETGAFSFYYLSMREAPETEDRDIAGRVAETYAVLLGRENESAAVEEGQELFTGYLTKTHEVIEGLSFV